VLKRLAILVTVFSLGLGAPAIANPTSISQADYNPASPSDGMISRYLALLSRTKRDFEGCRAHILKYSQRIQFECVEPTNEKSRVFNRISERMCGNKGLWAGTTFCARANIRFPMLQPIDRSRAKIVE
jgi:hypothetical protein